MVFKSDLILVYKSVLASDILIVNYTQYRIKSATNLISHRIRWFLIPHPFISIHSAISVVLFAQKYGKINLFFDKNQIYIRYG